MLVTVDGAVIVLVNVRVVPVVIYGPRGRQIHWVGSEHAFVMKMNTRMMSSLMVAVAVSM